MLKIKEYVKVKSLSQAYELNQKKNNKIIGGMLWLKMGNRRIQTAIDLSELGLDKIDETEQEFVIGSMVTLRELETHPGFCVYTKGAARDSVKDIVGVQFRNLATVGGSLYGRFGFSDVLTFFLALDTQVELYHAGRVSLEEFSKMPKDRDILVRVIVKKHSLACTYLAHRNTRTDFPVLACALSVDEREGKIVVGARPSKAVMWKMTSEEAKKLREGKLTDGEKEAMFERVSGETVLGSNMRASREYREHLLGVLVERGLDALNQEAQGGEQA